MGPVTRGIRLLVSASFSGGGILARFPGRLRSHGATAVFGAVWTPVTTKGNGSSVNWKEQHHSGNQPPAINFLARILAVILLQMVLQMITKFLFV